MERLQKLSFINQFVIKALEDTPDDIPENEKAEKLWKFFMENDPPYPLTIDALAEGIGIPPQDAEKIILNMIGGFVGGGKSKGKAPKGISQEAMNIGMEIEKEHTEDPFFRSKIVFDHITEHGNDYYSEKIGLPAMEKGLTKKNDES